MAANCRQFLDKVDLETGAGKIKGGLNAADPPTDNHHVAEIPVSQALAELVYPLFQLQVFVHVATSLPDFLNASL
jgi:hypothetical protein